MRKTKRRRGLATAVACLLTVAVAIPTTQTAAADDEPTQDTSAEESRKAQGAVASPIDPRMAAQAAAQGVSDEIDIAVRKHGLGGFTGLRVAPDKVWLHWKGDVPAEVTGIVEAAPQQVQVEVVPARYSLEEFNAQARQLTQQTPSSLGNKVLTAGPSRDFDRLEVGTEQPISARTQTLLADMVDGMPLAFHVAEKSTPLASRWDDSAPFWGGAAIGIDNFLPGGPDATCSTGFPVNRASTPGIISAQHCGAEEEWRTPEDTFVGDSNAGNSGVDAMLLTGGESYGTRIYTSDFEADAKNSIGIGSAANPAMDSFVFASGAFSGASVVRVTAVNQFRFGVGPGFITLNEEGEASIGQGDSGGPVAGADPDDLTQAIARGMVDQGVGDPADECSQGVEDRDCFVSTFHVNIGAIENALGVTVRTQ